MIDNIKKEVEKIYIIQPILNSEYRSLHSEAVALIESAGGICAGTIYQEIRTINPATYIGSGKVEELRCVLNGLEGITILFNGDLSPSQTLNLSHALDDRKVIDRTTLILDIFAKNAVSTEGKIQVELTQLKYIYPRLKGKGEALSRLGGGIGTRGPGETQLESDRRLIRERIKFLSNKLSAMEQRRALQSERRKKNNVKTIALVGYTNTGKSTLMNALTDSNVYAKDELFATLDPTSRKLNIDGVDFILTDTVGFLRNLPHHLIESFKSTLQAAIDCDLALIVCDAKDDYENQLKVTINTLEEMNFSSPYIILMNKCEDVNCEDFPSDYICISAKNKLGLNELKRTILNKFKEDYIFCSLKIPYEKYSEYSKIKKYLTERNINYNDDAINIDVVIPSVYGVYFKEYISEYI